jgi:hypothetical protein
MPRTQIDGDLIEDGSIGFEELSESVNAFGSKEPKIYRLSGYHNNFQEIDYTILNLYPRRYFNKGELYKCEWFRDRDLTDMVLVVDIEYTRDWVGFALSRATTRTWVNNDNTLNPFTKVTIKDYTINDGETIAEGKARRGALVDNIQMPMLSAMHEALLPQGWQSLDIMLNGREFLDEYDAEFNKFVKNSSTVTKKSDPDYGMKTIVVKFRDEQNPDYVAWLDVPLVSLDGQTIRTFLISEFSI